GLMQLHKRKPAVSMLVVGLEAAYFKKAVGRTSFICEDGELIQRMVDETIATGEARSVKAKSTGTNKDGELIAEFYITWSFKAKSNKN
ncbi:MAG: thioesterase, partial [Bacteroidota bacterium]|nr:thioesterase [Bacteroidota bacterium]